MDALGYRGTIKLGTFVMDLLEDQMMDTEEKTDQLRLFFEANRARRADLLETQRAKLLKLTKEKERLQNN